MAVTDDSSPAQVFRGPPGARGAKELIDLLFAVALRLRDNFAVVAGEFGLSPLQARALATLDPQQPLSMRQLASAVGCDASTVTDIIDKLEGMGLVERRPDTKDRRVKWLAITAAGLSTRVALFPKVLAHAPITRLAPEEQTQLRTLLNKVLGSDAFPEGHGGPPPMPVEHPRDP
jgi:DNA-binding MarR family transcriptional regulator